MSSSNASSGLVLSLGWQPAGLVWGLGYLRISCPGGWRRIAGNHNGRKTSDCCMCEPWSGVWSANPVGHTHTCSELKCKDSSYSTPTPAYNVTLKKQNMFFPPHQGLHRLTEVKIYPVSHEPPSVFIFWADFRLPEVNIYHIFQDLNMFSISRRLAFNIRIKCIYLLMMKIRNSFFMHHATHFRSFLP